MTQLALSPMRAGGGAIVNGASTACHSGGTDLTPPPIPLATVAAAVLRMIRDDTLAGRAIVPFRGGDTRMD